MRYSEVRMNEFPLFSLPLLKIVVISLCNLFISRFTVILFCDGINQILVGINSNPMAVFISLMEDCSFLLLGQRWSLDILSLSACFIDVNSAFCFSLLIW
jgi:hypothetical protein